MNTRIEPQLRDGLPASIEMEKLVLGAVMINESNYEAVNSLDPDDFALEKHKRIFSVMATLSNRGVAIDRVTVGQELHALGQLESVDGFTYLATLDDSLPQIYNLESYIRIVREKAVIRKAALTAMRLAREICDAGGGVESVERASAELSALMTSKSESPLRTIGEVISEIGGMDVYMQPPVGIAPPWPKLAEVIPCFQPGQLIVLGARPATGKTAWAGLVGLHAARLKVGTAVFSLEMPAADLFKRVLAASARVSFSRLRDGNLDESHRYSIRQSVAEIDDLPLWLSEVHSPTVSQINRALDRAEIRGRKTGLLIVDYLQLVTPSSGAGNRNEQVADMSRRLKLIAMDRKIPVIALSQLNRSGAKDDSPPDLSDLRDSGAIEQDADVVMFLHCTRKEKQQAYEERRPVNVELHVAKQRNGSLGLVRMQFDGRLMRMEST